MTRNRWRFDATLLLSCTGLFRSGCGIVDYPEFFAAPEFEEYRLTTETFPDWWKCSYEPFGTICEATVTRNDNADYVVQLVVSSNNQHSYEELSELSPGDRNELVQESASLELTHLPPRVLTEQEADRMKALFSNLHINRHPSPFTLVCCLGGRLLRVHRWDDVQLGTHTHDGAMIDFLDSDAIVAFFGEFVPIDLITE